MRLSSSQWLNALAVAGVGAMMIAAGAQTPGETPRGVDPIVTASTGPDGSRHGTDRFTVIDHRTQMSCPLVLHRAKGYDVHRIEPDPSCDRLGDSFARARAWREDGRGTVTITDHRCAELMRLAPGDGLAWEVVEPSHMRASLAAH